jgi:hypothetical protein
MSKITKRMIALLPGKELLHNRGILYTLCMIALLQIVMYGNVKDFNSIIMLLVIGFLTSFFSKNMIVILGTAIVATYMLNYVPYGTISEGAENMDKEDKPENMDKEDKPENMDKEDKPENMDKEDKPESVDDIASGQASLAEKATAPTPEEQKEQLMDSLQSDFGEFQKIQESILTGMKDIDPLLTKAEKFISKFEYYSKKLGESSEPTKDEPAL